MTIQFVSQKRPIVMLKRNLSIRLSGISEKLAKVLVHNLRRFLRTKNGKELELLGSVARPFGNDVATDGVIMPQSLH